MSEQTLTVNGKTAGAKKTILLPSRPKKRLFIGMLSLVTMLAAAILFVIWYIGVPGLERIQPPPPWAGARVPSRSAAPMSTRSASRITRRSR